MSLEDKFKIVCDQARKFSKKPPDGDMLEVYALYKQATVGNCNTGNVKSIPPKHELLAKPTEITAKAKWEAWNAKKGLDANAAKEQYIAKIKTLAPTYA